MQHDQRDRSDGRSFLYACISFHGKNLLVVSKRELLDWINSLLGLQYTKVEQACTGAAYCQILDALYPGKVPLSKVNFKATHDFEYVANFKIVQSVFAKCGIDKVFCHTFIFFTNCALLLFPVHSGIVFYFIFIIFNEKVVKSSS